MSTDPNNLELRLSKLQDDHEALRKQNRANHEALTFLLKLRKSMSNTPDVVDGTFKEPDPYERTARAAAEDLQRRFSCNVYLLLNEPGSEDPASLTCYGSTPHADLTFAQLEERLLQSPKYERKLTPDEGKPFGKLYVLKDPTSDATDSWYEDLFLNNISSGLAEALTIAYAFKKQNDVIRKLSRKLVAKLEDTNLERKFKISSLLPFYFEKESGKALLDKYIARARNESTDLSLMFIDIDEFGLYNNTFGHLQGDYAIKATADEIFGHVRHADKNLYKNPAAIGKSLQEVPKDFGIHFGGDEICLILYGAGKKKAVEIAERIMYSVTKLSISQHSQNKDPDATYREQGLPYAHVTISMGIDSLGLETAKTRDELMGNANIAEQWSKSHGRDCFGVYDSSMRPS